MGDPGSQSSGARNNLMGCTTHDLFFQAMRELALSGCTNLRQMAPGGFLCIQNCNHLASVCHRRQSLSASPVENGLFAYDTCSHRRLRPALLLPPCRRDRHHLPRCRHGSRPAGSRGGTCPCRTCYCRRCGSSRALNGDQQIQTAPVARRARFVSLEHPILLPQPSIALDT